MFTQFSAVAKPRPTDKRSMVHCKKKYLSLPTPHFEAVIQPPGHTLRGTHKPILLFVTILILFAPPPPGCFSQHV